VVLNPDFAVEGKENIRVPALIIVYSSISPVLSNAIARTFWEGEKATNAAGCLESRREDE